MSKEMPSLHNLTFICVCLLTVCFTARHSFKQLLRNGQNKKRVFVSNNHEIDVSTFSSTQPATPSTIISTQLRDNLKGTCIYIIGMMGCGKSTISEYLAKNLQYRSLDTDVLAEYMIEMPIHQFFHDGREPEFREVEYQVLMQLSQYTRVVVATGGGIVLKRENWGLLQHGLVVFLDLPPENIYERFKERPEEVSKRPLLQSADPLARLQDIYAQRKELYEAADVTVRVNPQHSPEQTADRVIAALMDFIKLNPPRWQTWKAQREETALEVASMVSSATSTHLLLQLSCCTRVNFIRMLISPWSNKTQLNYF